MGHLTSCFCDECLWPTMVHMKELSKTLFECLMNRIYNTSDFDRLGPPSERERKIIDQYLEIQGELNGTENNTN